MGTMSTDETRPQDATSGPGGPADAGSAEQGARYSGPAVDPAEPASEPQPDAAPDAAPASAGQQPYPESGFFASIRRGLFPRSDQRWVGGVAGGVAERIGWDPLLVRGLLIISFFLGGLGLVLYGIAWALLPERDGRIHLQEAARGNFDVAMLGSVAVFLIGFAWGGPIGWWDNGGWEWLGALFWLAVLGVTAYLIVQGVQRHRESRRAGYGPATPGAVPTPTVPTPGAPAATPGAPGSQTSFAPAPPVDYRRPDGLVHATGAGPAPHRQPQYRAAPPPTPPLVRTAPPPVRVRRGPGSAAVGITFGLILLGGALLLAAERVGATSFATDGFGLGMVWVGASTVVVGIAIVVSALRGRTSGVLGFLGILALLFGLTYITFFGSSASYLTDEAVVTGRQIEDIMSEPENPDAATLTEGTVTVQTIREAENGFYVRWGDPVIDLSELDLSDVEPGESVLVPIELGAGQAVVVVPADVPVDANAYIGAGNVRWTLDEQDRATSGVGSSAYFASDEVGDDGAVLSLDIRAGAGEVIVSEIERGSTR
ncbi:phage shock protein C (PspC) family protein [Promicromonospora thailandica]|uniref:Phage shock protein C (PspC) family protein n=2 Tax=Promicromonospora thailandica TaxID=765201 RepID=A0A9X2G0P3_9MICO|nr:phage shock protein C (PspC) family protein [Promicromonospora thailandica]